MIILEETIEQVRSSADIVDVIGQYIPLRKKGKNFWGVCPFHSEKTPSFSVTREKQIFHCFGCHQGGNVFKFLMEYKKISYPEAITELANELGIIVRYAESRVTEKQSGDELLFDLNEEIARLFFDTLQNDAQAKNARDYFASRKLKTTTIRSFGLGYSPASRTFLSEHLSSNDDKIEQALHLGLIGKHDNGRYYDRFAGRIIFPIFSPNGRVIAFAGRIMEKREDTAKYLNSPESSIYHKGKVLYGLSHAKDEIRKLDYAILVEGYMDLLALHQNGIKNVIAVSGTALTDDQVALLSRYTKNVFLLFDADEAGIKASMRSVEILLKRNMTIKIASLAAGEDPDSYINTYGKDEFLAQLDKAVNFFEFQFAFYKKAGKLDDPDKSVEIIRELLKPFILIDDELKQAVLLQSLAQKFNLREKLLESELIELKKKNAKTESQTAKRIEYRNPPESKTGSPAIDDKQFQNPMEKELVKLLFEGEKEIVELINKFILEDEFVYPQHKALAEIVFNALMEDEDISVSALADKIHDENLLEYLTKLVFEPHVISDEWEKLAPSATRQQWLAKSVIDTIKKFKLLQIDQDLKRVNKELQSTVTEDKQMEFLVQIKEMQETKKSIEAMLDKNYTDSMKR